MKELPESNLIKIVDISPNLYNPQEMSKSMMSGLIANMRKHGFTDPIKVRLVLDVEKAKISTPYVIVDGEHRWRAFKEVFPEVEEIFCIIQSIEQLRDAMQSTYSSNILHGDSNPVKLAEVVSYLIKDGMPFEEMDDLMRIDKNRADAMMESLEIPEAKGNLDDFTGSDIGKDEGSGMVKSDKIITSFAIYPEQKDAIERAIEKFINKQFDILEEDKRGEALFEMAKQSGEPELRPLEEG